MPKMRPQLQRQIQELAETISFELSQSELLSPDTLMRIDDAIFEVSAEVIRKATHFSSTTRRDVVWKHVSEVSGSSSKSKAEQMLKIICEKFDKVLFSLLITCSHNEQNSIKMAIEHGTNDTLEMLGLDPMVYAESVNAQSEIIPQLKQMS